MSFKDLLETAQCIALANKLNPDDTATWERYCREFSKRFSMSLVEVRNLDPLFVITEVTSDNLADLKTDERIEDVLDMIGSLSDPDYDANQERALREENRKIIEEERERVKNNLPIHKSLAKDKNIKSKETPPKELPKSGGINMALINKLNSSDNEG